MEGTIVPPGPLRASCEYGHGASMSDPLAELSSVTSAIEELTRRVTAIAEEFAARKKEDLATDLYAVERALTTASRRLGRLIDGR